ncbi:MAG: aerotolerance regulator BatA [Halobacteriovoraceae bacterium]|nr:aerotolerance regulator BatA [Halobacteriovoraceae bacterium]
MEFKHPIYFVLAAVFALAYLLKSFQFGKKAEFFIPKKFWNKKLIPLRLLAILIGFVGVCLIGFSLTQPRTPMGYSKNKIKVNDIFIVVDVSRSMLAEDFEPNRLEAAKNRIRDFVKLRPTDRIGIIMFSEKVFTLLPLSTDLKLIDQVVSEINVGFLGMGTNIGDALGLAVGRTTQSLAESKVIILLTDGFSNVGNMTPLQAAEQAKAQGVKVYTIGIGKEADDAKLQIGRGSGRYQRIPGGSVDLETLDKIAEITKGKSFYASNENSLQTVLEEIQKLEKTEIETSSKVIYKELYWDYLKWGVLLFLMGEILTLFVFKEIA